MQDTPIAAADLELLLAMNRTGTLAEAAQRLSVDASTVFRNVQRLEKRLGQRLFERTRRGYLPTEAALALAVHAERIEAELEAARAALPEHGPSGAVSGLVRVTTTDTFAQGLVLPSLAVLMAEHPRLRVELTATNELASLTRRDAEVALRATKRAPDHLVGRKLGVVRVAVYAAPSVSRRRRALEDQRWIAPDEGLPEHPTVRWRRKTFPKLQPALLVNSIGGVADAVEQGLGIGALPIFLGERRGLRALSEPLADCETDLWVLTHPESRHLRRIAVVAEHFSRGIALP